MLLTVAGVDVTAWLAKGTLEHLNALNAEPDTLSFELVATNGAGPCPVLVGGSDVLLVEDGVTTFGGVLGTPSDKPLKVLAGYACTAVDWRARLDQRVLNARRRNMTAGQMIAYLAKKYAPGFDTSLVDLGGEVLGSVRFKPPERLTAALDRLAALTGYVWDVTPDKAILWGPPGSVPAPWPLVDGADFEDLTVTEDRSELVNRVVVLGARTPVEAVTERFTGDGVSRHWPLSFQPYAQDDYLELDEPFSSFDVAAGGKWVQTDATNPSPPAGHTGTDGYLFTTTMSGGALSESGWLQIVGGTGTWGQVALMSAAVYARGDGAKRFELDVWAGDTTGQGRFGLWDPNNQAALAGEAWGVFFDAGTLKASMAGVTSGSTLAYTGGALDSYTRIRITPKSTAGALIQAQTGANYGTRNWTTLLDTNTGSLANLTFAAAFSRTFSGRADRARVYNRLYGVSVTVAGVAKTIGLLNADESSGVDAVLGGTSGQDSPSLSFFSDVIPAAGAAIVLTYYRAAQVRAAAQDGASIAACIALEGGDGVHEAWIEDTTCDTVALAQTRASQELALYANAARTVTYTTRTPGLRAGQVQPVDVANRQRPVSGSFLITSVVRSSLGAPGWSSYQVTASSRLKGPGSLVLELLRAGKKLDTSSLDDGSVITEFAFGDDPVAFEDAAAVAAGPLPPFRWEMPAIVVTSQADWNAGTHTRTVATAGGDLTIAMPTFSRASVPVDVPRFPAVAGTVGLLVEQGATNNFTYSEPATASDYRSKGTNTAMTTSLLPGLAAMGFGVAYEFSRPPSGSTTLIPWIASATVAGETWCVSCYVEFQDGGAPVVSTTTGAGDFSMVVTNAIAGIVGSEQISATVWRVWGALTVVTPHAACGTYKYAGQSTRVFQAIGWQMEKDTRTPTTYVPTAGSAVTRAVERLQLPAYPFQDASQGTIIAWTHLDSELLTSTANHDLIYHSDTGAVNNIRLTRFTGSSGLVFRIGDGAGALTTATWAVNPLPVSGGPTWLAGRWNGASVDLVVNAIQRATTAGGGRPSAPPTQALDIGGQGATANRWNQAIYMVAYYPTRLSDAEIAAEQASLCAGSPYRLAFHGGTLVPVTTATHVTAWLDSGAEGETEHPVQVSYTRSSTRSDPLTGAPIASGVPAFVDLAGTVGLWVEEAATNVIGTVPTFWDTYTSFSATGTMGSGSDPTYGTYVTITKDPGINGRYGKRLSALTNGGGSGTVYTYLIAVRPTTTTGRLALYVDMYRAGGGAAITAYRYVDLSTLPQNEWTVLSVSGGDGGTMSSGGNVYAWLDTAAGGTCDVARPTMVMKDHPVSVMGLSQVRAAENVSFAADQVLRGEEGAILCRVYVTDWLKGHVGANAHRPWIAAGGTGTSGLFIIRTDTRWYVGIRNTAGQQFNAIQPSNTSIPVGWHWMLAVWKAGVLEFWMDGAVVGSTTYTGTVVIPAVGYVGSGGGSTGQLNSAIADFTCYWDAPDAATAVLLSSQGPTHAPTGQWSAQMRGELTAWQWGQAWDPLVATETAPAGTSIAHRFRWRASPGGAGETAYNPDLTAGKGRLVQVETTLTTSPGAAAAPTVSDLSLTPTAARAGLCTVDP